MDEGKGPNPYFDGLHGGESEELRAMRLALVKERDELHVEASTEIEALRGHIARLIGMDDAMQAEWDRECGDTDEILRALGLDPANCRTDGGSLKVEMVLGAIEHRDVMRKREAVQPWRIAVVRAVPAMQSYASKNPKHYMNDALQDPCGVHAWLAEFGSS